MKQKYIIRTDEEVLAYVYEDEDFGRTIVFLQEKIDVTREMYLYDMKTHTRVDGSLDLNKQFMNYLVSLIPTE